MRILFYYEKKKINCENIAEFNSIEIEMYIINNLKIKFFNFQKKNRRKILSLRYV